MRSCNIKKSWSRLILAVALTLCCAGCGGGSGDNAYLIEVGEIAATKQDFNRFWDAYAAPIYANADMNALNDIDIRQTKQEAFDQFVITLLLDARAEDLGIFITNEELEAEVVKVREEYSEDVFKETLLKSAMPYELWREGLRRRLLMEMVMRADLYAYGEITPEDVEMYGGLSSAKTKIRPEEVLERVYRAKAENDFKDWIEKLQAEYPVKIDYEELAAVLSE